MKKTNLFTLIAVGLCMVMCFTACGSTDTPTGETGNDEGKLPPVESAVIGTMSGSVNEPLVKERFPNAEAQSFKNYDESCQALLDKEIDYAIMDYATAMNFARHNAALTVAPEKLSDEVTAIALNPNAPERNEKIKDIVARYISDGTADEIISHWIKEDGSEYEILPSTAPTEGEKLRIAVTTATEPRCFMQDGKPVGMVIELMDNICAELGMVPEYKDMAFGEMMDSLKNNECDVIPAIYNTPERAAAADFTEGYFPNPQVLLVLTERISQ